MGMPVFCLMRLTVSYSRTLFVVATFMFGGSNVGPTLTDEELNMQSEARRTAHDALNPGAQVDQAKIDEAKAMQEAAAKEAEDFAKGRARMKMILQIIGGLAIVAGIVLYVVDKQSEG
jgi:hypothetical protein